MAKDYSKYTKEELVNYIQEIEEQLRDKKYGLYWDKEIEKEINLNTCLDNIPILEKNDILSTFNSTNQINNILIEGDNFHSLTTLKMMSNGEGFVDVIYIDPPYNTGNKDFIYNDKYIDEDDGYRHSKWLNFMHKRLSIARDILADDGVIFISIDDNEQANLKLLCDQVFGVKNFLVSLVINSAPAGTQSSTDFALQHSYCLVYRKSSQYSTSYVKLTEEEIKNKYSYGQDELGYYYIERIWKRGIGGRMEDVPSLHFPVWYDEKNNLIYIDEEADGLDKENLVKIIPYQTKGVLGRWTWSKKKMKDERDHLIVTKVAGEWKLHKKVYSSQDQGKKPYSIIGSKLGRTELGSLELKQILGDKLFDYPKFSGFIKYLIGLHDDPGAIVLDFFAGSGTTGQAVMELNKEDGGSRRFILCTNNENNICQNVTLQRLNTVISGYRKDGSIYSEGLSNNNLIYYNIDFIKDSKNTDQAKYCLVDKVDGLLSIVEDMYIKINRNEYSGHYCSNDYKKHMFIYSDYYNEENFNNFVNDINNVEGKKIIYIFSSDNNIDSEIKNKLKNVIIKPIPSKIYEIYKEIVEDLKRN